MRWSLLSLSAHRLTVEIVCLGKEMSMLKKNIKMFAGQLCIAFVLCLVSFVPLVSANGVTQEHPVYTRIVEGGSYNDTLQAVKQIIEGRGINIAHTLPPSEMLQRTGPAFGITQPVLKDGEIIEFCSAKISHQLILANPENISLCPFTVSVYVLNADPGNVRLTFRKPFVIDDASREAVDAMTELVRGIIDEAAEW
jgi:uncharacterized protein (DUF302 family)